MPGQLEKGDHVVGATAEFARLAAVAPHAEGMLDEAWCGYAGSGLRARCRAR